MRDSERGSLSLMIVVLFAALVALTGIVVDGGAKLTGIQNATAVAQEAARAGATSVDVSRAYATGTLAVDQQQAVTAARAYLIAARYRQYTVAADGAEAVRVTVRITIPTRFLSLIGIDSFTCTGTAIASLVAGVTGPS